MMGNAIVDTEAIDSPRTVLLVEDDPFVLKWVHAQLEQSGYNLLEAGDGSDALVIAELHRGPIDLVVTDVMMPKLNGPDLVTQLLRFRPDVRVLYMSGIPEAVLRKTTNLPPTFNYLQKPFAMTALLDKITELLGSDSQK